jgi:hypothetical protein
MHLQFENFSGGTAPEPPAAGVYTPSRTLPLNPHFETQPWLRHWVCLANSSRLIHGRQ